MKTNKVHISQIPQMEFRFDPPLHLSEGVKVRSVLNKLPFENKTLAAVTEKIFLGNIFSRIWVKDNTHGIPYLAASDTILANLDTGQFLAKRQGTEMPYLMLKPNWILVTCSGTLGKTTYTNNNFNGRIATHDLIRIIPDQDKMPGGYIYAFLSGKYGYYQITQSQFGGVVKHVNASQAGKISIPELPKDFQGKIDEMIKDAARLREEATELLDKAKNFFNSKIKLSQGKKIIRFLPIKNIQESQNKRFEGNYYSSEGAEYENLIKENFEYKPLEHFFYEISRPDIFKRNYVSSQSGLMLFNGSELFLTIPQSNKYISKRISKRESLNLKEGWILLPRSGTIGNVVYANHLHEKGLASEDIIRLKPKDKNKGAYVYAFLSSNIGKSILEKSVFGSVIQHIEPPMLKIIPIPIFKNQLDEISNLVIEGNKKLGLAGQLELDAITMVESEIEKWTKE